LFKNKQQTTDLNQAENEISSIFQLQNIIKPAATKTEK